MKLLEMFKTKRAAVARTAWQEYADILTKGENVKQADIERLAALQPMLGIELTEERIAADAALLARVATLTPLAAEVATRTKRADEAAQARDEYGAETFKINEQRAEKHGELHARWVDLDAHRLNAVGASTDLEQLKATNPQLLSFTPPPPWDPVQYERPTHGTRQQQARDAAGGSHPDPETFDRVWQDILVRLEIDASFEAYRRMTQHRQPMSEEQLAGFKPEAYAGIMTLRRVAIRRAAGDQSNYVNKRNIEVARKRLEERIADERAFRDKRDGYRQPTFSINE